ncbi:unnamed protein product [Blepharisma stoltei]|uniref:AAA+ ATPase domain-containing protein n=1 Tax=Blepharisma stoltei TaxID=1481888 RepID=A0AAU9K6M4_9CILI|nr:unnamed protein product [Blepharisma stoltei]
MFARQCLKSYPVSILMREFSKKKPPRGFEKFYKKAKPEEQIKPEEEPRSNMKFSSNPWSNQFEGFFKNNRRLAYGLGGALFVYYLYTQRPVPLITYHDFLNNYLIPGNIKKLVASQPMEGTLRSLCTIYIYDSKGHKAGIFKVANIQDFLHELYQDQISISRMARIPIEYKSASDWVSTSRFLVNIVFLVLLIASFRNHFKNMNGGGSAGKGGIFSMAKQNFRVYGLDKKIDVGFKDVAGLHEAKKEIMEFVEFLKNPKKYKNLGARMPKGALLVGPPGTGKTLLAKATAGEAGVPFFAISGSDFVEMYVGVGASRVRDLFQQAREKAPSIIFIDEIDAVGKKRHDRFGGNDEADNTLNQLLVEMDGFPTDSSVVVMAGTNRKDILDEALLRPGRFDRCIELNLPDIEAREEILKIHLKPLTLSNDMTLDGYAKRLAELTPGFSGAELANLCNEGAITAARKDKESVDQIDFEVASERVIGGLEKSKKLNPKEKKLVAYHEAGHAVSGWFLEGAEPILKVSILPRSKGALGFAQYLPRDISLYSKEELLDRICVILGGRAAEELFFDEPTTGASDDLQKATKIAESMVVKLGMCENFGIVGYKYEGGGYSKPFSQDTGRLIDEEIRKIVRGCLERTRQLISEKKDQVMRVAELLIEKERILTQDLVEILGERQFDGAENYAFKRA